jgi:hypothetical protein
MPSEVKPWYTSTRYYRMPRWPWRFRTEESRKILRLLRLRRWNTHREGEG